MTFFKWSRTAASDATADSTINYQEGQAPSTLNDAGRGVMAAAAKYRDDTSGAIVTTGTGTAYAFSSYQGFTSLASMDGQEISFSPHAASGTPCQINVDGYGLKPLRLSPGVELPSGVMPQGSPQTAVYNASNGEWYLKDYRPTTLASAAVGTAALADGAVTPQKMYQPSATSQLLGSDANAALNVTGAANNGSGLVRLTVGNTATFATGQKKNVKSVAGTTEANGTWTITVVDGTHIDLQGSAFANAYTSGGTIGGGVEEVALGAGLSMGAGPTLVNSKPFDPTLLPGYLSGLTLSTAGGSATFGVAAGVANDAAAGGMMNLASAISKTTSAWAVGNNNGALDTGVIGNSTWYHAFLIERVDSGVVDVLVSLSPTTPTLPANYTLSRRIGSMKTDGSGHWIAFTQTGDQFIWSTSVTDVNNAVTVASRVSKALSTPLGVVTAALFRAQLASGGASNPTIIFTSLQESDQAPANGGLGDLTVTNTTSQTGSFERLTDTSSQIGVRANNTTTNYSIFTYGWKDTRGK